MLAPSQAPPPSLLRWRRGEREGQLATRKQPGKLAASVRGAAIPDAIQARPRSAS